VPDLRPARDGDVASMMEVFWASLDDLAERHGRPPSPRNPAVLEELMRHFVASDPDSSLVADERGRIVGFGMLHVRGDTGFLAFLFVLPDWQARGLGRRLLDACIDGAGRPARMGTCAEADQPISTGIYASMGMAPRMPIYLLRGGLSPYRLPSLPDGIRARRLASTDVTTIDDEVLGYQHPIDHAFLVRAGRHGWAFEDAGAVVGYGYVQASGRLGPVAATDERLLHGFIGHLTRSITVPEGWQVMVPGASVAMRLLLEHGLRIDGTPAVYCSDHAGPRFDRYLPTSFALM
jgi:GNAT superfamily N-acetyltransferase